MSFKLLIINPGSTSTKIGVYEDEKQILEETLRHTTEEIARYGSIFEQFEFRKEVILKILKEKNFDINTLDAIVGRGGMLKPIEGGTYRVNEAIIEDLKVGVQGQHASNLGGILANEIAKPLDIPAFIVDPVVVDEMQEVARITGFSEIRRKSIFHALNQKAVAKRYAKENGKQYDELNLIVAHMGGGISVGAHKHGKVVDVNNAVDGEGPFSPERAGGLPTGDLVKMCFSGEYTYEEMKKKLNGKGGLNSLQNSNDVRKLVDDGLAGDEKAMLLANALVYNVAKEIGKYAAVLQGKVDAIIVTGGIAYNKFLTGEISKYVSFIAPVVIYPGEDELLALAQGAISVLSGKEKAKEY